MRKFLVPAPADTTFCFTDIEGSTRLMQAVGTEAYEAILERQRELIRAALDTAGGEEIKTEGDGFFIAFRDAYAALTFAAAAQRALGAEPWPRPVRVRMGMHRGFATRRADGDYVALEVHQAARVAAVAHGGQVLCTADVVAGVEPPESLWLQPLGEYRLRDFDGGVPLLQLAGEGLLDGFAPLAAPRESHGVRLPRSAMVGRESELDRLRSLLASQRLVSLVGMGGVGKTRLALEAAAGEAARFPDGFHLVELAPLPGPERVGEAVAAAIGVRPNPGVEPLDAVVAAVGDRRQLLLLDSCEKVLDEVAWAVDRVLNACPRLSIMATTTSALRVESERVMRIGPLAVPEPDAPPGELAKCESVRLLVQRATAAGATIDTSDDEQMVALADIAARLDGIPLALELAAARVSELGIDAVLAALDDRFALLTSGLRSALPHHRTLEAMVAWSVELLKPEDIALLSRLSVLLGRWEPSAAASVCESADGVAAIHRLADQSLIVLDERPSLRIRILDTIRAFALRSLREPDRQQVTARRLEWLRRHYDAIRTVTEAEYIESIDALIPDMRQIMAAPADDDIEAATMVAASCASWFEARGLWSEGLTTLTRCIERCPPGDALTCARAGLAQLRAASGDLDGAREMAQLVIDDPDARPRARGLALVVRFPLPRGAPTDEDIAGLHAAIEENGFRSSIGLSARSRLALLAQWQGRASEAASQLESVVGDAHNEGFRALEAQARLNLGGMLIQLGDHERAAAELEAARRQSLDAGYRSLAAGALTNMGLLAMRRGDYERALQCAEERLALAEQLGDRRGVTTALSLVGTSAAALGDMARALEATRRSVAVSRELDFSEATVVGGFNLSAMASKAGEFEAAVRAARGVIDDARSCGSPALQTLALFAAGAVLAHTGADEAAAILAAGRSLAPEATALDPNDEQWIADAEAKLEAEVAADGLSRAGDRGRSLSWDDAFDVAARALSELDTR